MGKDITAFVEYRYRHSPADAWRAHTQACLEREYAVFAAIAALGDPDDHATVFAPRGFPHDAAAFTQLAYYVHVVADQELVTDGLARFVRANAVPGILRDGGHYRHQSANLVSDPDALYPSWLTYGEIQSALRAIGVGNETLGVNWQLTLRSMGALEAEFGAEARLVFWFTL